MPDGFALAQQLTLRKREAVAPALNLLDDRRPQSRQAACHLLTRLEAQVKPARRIGFTGAPGVGKSTLLDTVLRRVRAGGESVGVLAVDPSSRRTGGALLGDRLRLRSGAGDPGVFLRSMASREHLGGLAEGARGAVLVLAAAFDCVFVETVGVGQSEAEVADLVDTLVFVAQPDSGDLIQFMKAGVLEWPDLLVVNKAEQEALAARAVRELKAGLALGEHSGDGWERPVLRVSARDDIGVDELVQALAAHNSWLLESGEHARRRRRGRDRFVRDTLERRFGSFGLESQGGVDAIQKRLDAKPDAAGMQLLEELSARIESALTGATPHQK